MADLTFKSPSGGSFDLDCYEAPSSPYTINYEASTGGLIPISAVTNTAAGFSTSATVSALGVYSFSSPRTVVLTGGTGGLFAISGGQ